LSRDYKAPDYLCNKFGNTVYIEAVTVNPTQNGEVKSRSPEPEELRRRLENFMPIKFGSALFSKLRKKYWKKEHVKGNPLIFAIHDFHEERSMLWSSSALPIYLYGLRHICNRDSSGKLSITYEKVKKHKWGGKEIPSGFFFLPDGEHVSAVLFSNSATLSKFNRMGKLARFGDPRVEMIRVGTCYNKDPNSEAPLEFKARVREEEYDESWGQGISMFHNPNALIPVEPGLFSEVAHHFFGEGRIVSYIPEFFPISSRTYIF
jgi:hypothetical protein